MGIKIPVSFPIDKLDEVLEQLHDPDWLVRNHAAEALAGAKLLHDPRVVPALIETLQDANSSVRGRAADSLGKLGAQQALGPLLTLAFHDNDWGVRYSATLALSDFQDARVIDICLNALYDDKADIREAAVRILGLFHYYSGIAKSYYLSIVEPLIGVLQDENNDVRTAVASTLGEIGDVRAVEPLIALLQDKAVRDRVVSALGKLKDRRAVEPLIEILHDDKDWSIRRDVIRAFGQIGGERAITQLLPLLQDQDHRLREEAIRGLAACQAHQAVEFVIAALQDSHFEVQYEAVRALGQLKDMRATKPLLAFLEQADDNILGETIRALGEIGDPQAITPLIALTKKDRFYWVPARALAKIGGQEAVDRFINDLDESSKEIRQRAIQILGLLHNKQAVEPLIRLLRDEDSEIRHEAVKSLGILNGKNRILGDGEPCIQNETVKSSGILNDKLAADALLTVIQQDKEKDIRESAAWSLFELENRRVVPYILPLIADELQDDIVFVRMDAIEQLKWIGKPAAVELLQKALNDEHHLVREAAAEALEEISYQQAPEVFGQSGAAVVDAK